MIGGFRDEGTGPAVDAGRIVDLLPLQHDPWRVEFYREAMRRGDHFPPVAVLRIGSRLFLTDGHKRLAAWRGLDCPNPIPVELWTWSRWYADQRRQALKTTRRLATIPHLLVRDPRAGLVELLAGPRHWARVVRSLLHFARRSGRRCASS